MRVTNKGQFRDALRVQMTNEEYDAQFGGKSNVLVDESDHFTHYYMSVGGQPVVAEVEKKT